jgi:hypothetical protein
MQTKSWVLATLIAVSILAAVFQAMLYWHGVEAESPFIILWCFVFVFLLVLWVDLDSKGRPSIYRPHEYGFLVFLFWIPYIPYYLWRTRGPYGLLALLGFAALYFLGYFAQWGVYVAR